MEAFARVGEAIRATSSKLEKTRLLGEYFAGLDDGELSIAAIFFSARPFADRDQRKLNLGYSVIRTAVCSLAQVDEDALGESYMRHSDVGDVIREILEGHTHARLTTVTEVRDAFAQMHTERNARKKAAILGALFDRLTPVEAKYTAKILTGDLRIGLRAGLVEDAIARAFDAPPSDVSWASMLSGDIGEVAVLARHGGLRTAELRLLHPLQFMLASPEEDAEAIMRRVGGEAWVEDKYDGIRGQLHKEGNRIILYSRDLNDVTAAFPEVVQAAQGVPHDLLLDGELLAFKDGVVRPFFELQHRLGRKVVSAQLLAEVPVIFVAFDLLYLDGCNLLLEPLRERRRELESLSLPSPFMLAYLIRALDAGELDRVFDAARARNNEGLMVKDPESVYRPGRRGLGWLKLKKALATLDVVVTGVEVGHGKRKNVLSDYTFAVYDAEQDRLVNIGKAYSGLTDAEIAQMTEHFRSITLKDYGRFRLVQPEVVLEVAFDAIMESGRHNSGYALRFPRIKQIRTDKTIRDIDTLANVARMHRAFTGERVQLVEPAQALTAVHAAWRSRSARPRPR
ncbi:MAG: ATP-dependent DNA ligase [Candidatus Dormibacteraeota bacterium]|nr:ATP-dependent DNA ligase [Candidatus Dormibacteraeota bacterium]